MQNKLQELTEKLYKEGLSKGQEEGEQIIASSRKQAQELLDKAKLEAKAITEKANKDVEQLKTTVKGELKMAANQALQATKQDIENIVVTKLSEDAVKAACKDVDFVKELVVEMIKSFSHENALDLSVVLPATMEKKLEEFVKTGFQSIAKGKLEASFSKKIEGGFTIGPKDGSYFVSMTDESFNNLIKEYLRPTVKKLLFG